MSCNTEQDVRLIMKYSTISGVEPTIPLSGDHTDGTWLPTDIYIGEIFTNSADNLTWIRTDNGIVPLAGSFSGTASFTGDYVPTSGGTFSGCVYIPCLTVGSASIDELVAGTVSGYMIGTFSGDGSLLTGITTTWDGGTVSNAVYFTNTVDFTNTINLNGPVVGDLNLTGSVEVSGGVSASIFYGDGSGLTNLPTGTYSDTYTTGAALSGSTILFTRNDTTTYDVDLTPILATQGIASIAWNSSLNTIELTLLDDSILSTTIDGFDTLTALTSVTAPEFYGGSFYGSFVGTFSGSIDNDIYTTGATLSGTELIFDRTDGASYSVDLSTLNTGGATGLGGVLTISNQTDGYDINLNAGDKIINDNGQQTIEFQETGILVQNKYTTSEYIYNGFLEVKNDVATSQLAHIRTDLTSGDKITTAVQIDDTTATITSNNETTYNEAFVRADSGSGTSPQAEVRLWTADFYGNVSYMNMNPGSIEVVGYSSDGFGGIEYGDDYSADYTNRSLVDKEYVDNAISGGSGATPSLSEVLLVGNTTDGSDIVLEMGDKITSGVGDPHSISFNEGTINIDNDFAANREGRIALNTGTSLSYLYNRQYDGGNHTEGKLEFNSTTSRLNVIDTSNGAEAYIAQNLSGGYPTQTILSTDAAGKMSQIYVDGTGYFNINVNDLDYSTDISISPTSGFIVDTENEKGIEYIADYSATFTNRSLVDKEYVDNAVIVGSSGTLEHTLMNGDTTGTQSIYISSSASQINGYNGVSHHWYDAVNPLAGKYFRIENGTGSSASFIQLMDNLRGDIHLYQGNAWNTSSDDAYRTSMYMGGNTQIATENRDFLTGTFWYKSISAVVGNGTSNETRDFLNDTSAQVATYTDGTGTDTHILIQSYHGGGAASGQIFVRQNEMTLKSEDNNISSSNITMNHTSLLLEAKDLDIDTETSIKMTYNSISASSSTPGFQGITYGEDYSANFTTYSLVDKNYVDNLTNGFIPIVSALETFRGRTFRVDSTTVDTYGGIDTLNNASAVGIALSSTNFYNKITRLRYYASIVATGRQTDIRGTDLQWYRGTGFRFVTTFRVADTVYGSTCQQFYGLGGYTTQLPYGGAGTTQLSTLLNLIGVGSEAADTNLQVFHNDGTGTCTKIDLGSAFPANRTAGAEMTTMYSIEIYNGNNQTDVKYRVKNLETGDVAQGTITTDLPATTQGLAIFASRVMGTPTTNTGQFEINRWGCYDIIYS